MLEPDEEANGSEWPNTRIHIRSPVKNQEFLHQVPALLIIGPRMGVTGDPTTVIGSGIKLPKFSWWGSNRAVNFCELPSNFCF